MNKQMGDFPGAYIVGSGLLIAGISVLVIFSGAPLGKIFLFGGAAAIAVGYFIQKDKEKNTG